MEHFCVSPTTVADQSPSHAPADRVLSRRSFIRYLGAGAAALAVEGCGAGAGSTAAAPVTAAPVAEPVAAPMPIVAAPPVPAPAPAPSTEPVPVWSPVPPLVFTHGTAASISMADYVSAANAKAFKLSLNTTPLPSGVTFNSATLAFDYDGLGAMAVSDGHILTAAVS